MSFYNTNKTTGQELKDAWAKATSQKERVYAICYRYIKQLGKIMTNRRIWWAYKKDFGPIELTSIRRSVSDLVSEGRLAYDGFIAETTDLPELDAGKKQKKIIINP